MKHGNSLLYFHCRLLQQTMQIKEIGQCEEKHILFF